MWGGLSATEDSSERVNDVLELDTSSKAFIKVKIIRTSTSRNVVLRHPFPDLCYVPDPHRLIYICERDHTNVVYCDDNESEWLVKRVRNLSYPGSLLYVPSHDVILVADMDKNFNLGLRSQTQHLILLMTFVTYDVSAGSTIRLSWRVEREERVISAFRISLPSKCLC